MICLTTPNTNAWRTFQHRRRFSGHLAKIDPWIHLNQTASLPQHGGLSHPPGRSKNAQPGRGVIVGNEEGNSSGWFEDVCSNPSTTNALHLKHLETCLNQSAFRIQSTSFDKFCFVSTKTDFKDSQSGCLNAVTLFDPRTVQRKVTNQRPWETKSHNYHCL